MPTVAIVRIALPSLLRRSELAPASGREGTEVEKRLIDSSNEFFAGRQHGLAVLAQRLKELSETEPELSIGAYAIAVQLVIASYTELQHKRFFPRGWPTIDPEGGVRIDWSFEGRTIRLVISAAGGGSSYIYHELGEDFGVTHDVTAKALAQRLDWLLGE